MGTLAEKLEYLAGTKEAIKQALIDRGCTISDNDTFRSYVNKLAELPSLPISITAVYTQTVTVTDADSLDTLRPDLVVTAYYGDGTTKVVTDYTLSGTLEVGTSTITASYKGKSDSFDVTVSGIAYLCKWDFTQSLTDEKQGLVAVLNGSAVYTQGIGIVITTKDDWVYLGDILKNGLTIEIDFTDFYVQTAAYSKLLISTDNYANTFGQRRYSSTLRYWGAYNQEWLSYSTPRLNDNPNLFQNKTAKFIFNDDNDFEVYANDVLKYKGVNFVKGNNYHEFNIGINDGRSVSTMTITGVRIYANQ